MTRPKVPRNTNLSSQVLGIFLILIGAAFVAMAMIVTGLYIEEITRFWGFPVATSGFGLFLIWLGITFLGTEDWKNKFNRVDWRRALVKHRNLATLIPAAGCVLMLIHAIGVGVGYQWLTGRALHVVAAAAVGVGLVTRSIVVPYNAGLFPSALWHQGSRLAQLAVTTVVSIDFVGYLAVFFVYFALETKFSGEWRFVSDTASSLLVAVLYASLFVVARFANLR